MHKDLNKEGNSEEKKGVFSALKGTKKFWCFCEGTM